MFMAKLQLTMVENSPQFSTENPFLTIITVTKNSSRTLADTIGSVRQQNFSNFEYIVVDGNSSDGTLEIIESNKDLIQVLISEEDNGLYFAMNKGISLAKGDYIGIINSDDTYAHDAFFNVKRLEEKLLQPSVIYSDMGIIGSSRVSNLHHSELESRMIAHPTCFVPRMFYEKYGSFNTDYQIAADYELMLRYKRLDLPFSKSEEILANYREGGLSSKRRSISILETLTLQNSGKSVHKFGIYFNLTKIMAKTLLRERLGRSRHETRGNS
jgi:glycosyltransferase involved in cell wall biosynthesis